MIEIYIYWISTTLLSLLYLASATLYLVKREWVRQALADLGYPPQSYAAARCGEDPSRGCHPSTN